MSAIEDALNIVKGVGGSALKNIGNLEAWGNVATKLHSNESITGDAIEHAKGMAGVTLRMMDNQSFGDAIKGAYTKVGADGKSSLDYGAIAGSYIGASAGYRVLSGGGLYRDKNGNANIIGVPFV